MPGLMTYDVFVSHGWEFHHEYRLLEVLLNNVSTLNWHNHANPEFSGQSAYDESSLERELERQIRQSRVVLILAGLYPVAKHWVQRQIVIAQSLNKPIIGIYPWEGSDVAQELVDSAEVMLGWSADSIATAIRGFSK